MTNYTTMFEDIIWRPDSSPLIPLLSWVITIFHGMLTLTIVKYTISKGSVRRTVRGGQKKSGLASEAISRILRQLEENGQVVRNPYNICKILVYSSFGYVEK